ncbi:helix-turn-helix domain-containing protein [Candidatus Poriferisocius sp.]|uniref:helix-turn-helix domain-containing protein n=1 Tax=Candidatus Poriferisocius sp. TaxID=3101276 RepID=UPI003B015A5B
MLRERRTSAGLSMRRAAETAEVSFMTWSRVEAGSQPDLRTFLRLCAWLRLPPETFLISAAPRKSETPDLVLRHLLTDPRLEQDAASRIASVVRDMYEALAREPSHPPTVACHLRAASVLRPGVADRLGTLLQDMRSKLNALDADGVL